ncbi:hypothetical protein [Deinococcus hohokamensis]|uniref:Uncharacterized protein n=1 Tax=Deinococcus hohokamensis TaxID=309883 RepID=A0ABV9I7S3_9DEIO
MKHVVFSSLLLLGGSVLAQQGPAPTSTLTRMPLTPGAVRVTDSAATKAFGGLLGTLAQGQKSRCTTSEYLVWDDTDLAETISSDLTAQIKKRGMTLTTLAEDEDDESYALSFLLTEPANRYAGVLYGDAESVVLGWCQLAAQGAATAAPKPAVAAPKPAAAPSPPKPSASTPSAPKPAAPAALTPAPPLGRYTCLRMATGSALGNTVADDITLLPGGRYTIAGVTGTYTYDPKTRLLTWNGGGLSSSKTGWVGMYDRPQSAGAPPVLRIRNRSDVQAGNMRDLQWCNPAPR